MIETHKPITKQKFDLEESTLEFAKNIVRLCAKLPQNGINRELISQMIRSGGSIGANYREANDALSKKDFYYRIRVTRKEAKETYYWLELLEAERRKAKELHYMKCPKCGMNLVEIDYKSLKVDRCSSCEGVWLDSGELAQIIKLEKGALDKLFSVFSK